MQERLLLYIDILGFSNLVAEHPERVDDLYEVVASLNAHAHTAFKCVVFSDTILVYNVDGGDTPRDISYLVMFMCEFTKDLMHRLTNRTIFFRAVITKGHFKHYELNDMPCFYGSALVRAHEAEKNIKAIGVFLDKNLAAHCDIFETTEFNRNFNFVYITQALNQIEFLSPPIREGWYVDDTELNWNAGPELQHLIDLLHASGSNFPESVLQKYRNSIELYKKRYPKIIACLIQNNLNLNSIAPGASWTPVIERHPENFSFAIKKRLDF